MKEKKNECTTATAYSTDENHARRSRRTNVAERRRMRATKKKKYYQFGFDGKRAVAAAENASEMEANGIGTRWQHCGGSGRGWQESVCTQMRCARYDRYSVIFQVQSHLQSFFFVSHIFSIIFFFRIFIFIVSHSRAMVMLCAIYTSLLLRMGFSQTAWVFHCRFRCIFCINCILLYQVTK